VCTDLEKILDVDFIIVFIGELEKELFLRGFAHDKAFPSESFGYRTGGDEVSRGLVESQCEGVCIVVDVL
jgi:hypothetical protein